MLKTLSLLALLCTLSACSLSSYLPFTGNKQTVIQLDEEKIDQKSYATAYEATIETYQGRVNQDYDVNAFANGVNDWYLNRILLPIEQIRTNLYQGGHDSHIHAYYSGVLFASALQTNFHQLHADCWLHLDKASLTQGISDAMNDLYHNKMRSQDDPYIVQGAEQVLKLCTK